MKYSKRELKEWANQFLFNPYSDKAVALVMSLSARFKITSQQVVDRIILLSK